MTTWTLIGHGCWVAGLAVLLAAGGFQSWRLAQPAPAGERATGPARLWGPLGLLLVALGLLLVSAGPLARGLWGLAALLAAGALGREGWRAYEGRRGQDGAQSPRELARRLWAAPQTRWAVGSAVSLGALVLAARGVDLSSVGATLLRANGAFIMLALLSVLVNILVKAVRWRILIGEQGRAIPLREVLRVLVISQMLNMVIPARVGELSRAYMLGRQGPGSAFILGTVALEKLLDSILYLMLVVLLILLMPVPEWISQPLYPFALIAVSSLVTVLLMSRYQGELLGLLTRTLGWLPQRPRERITRLAGAALSSLAILKDWRSSLAVSWWSAVVWVTAVLNNYLVLLALGIDAPPPAALLVLVVLQAGIAIPSVPGKIGVFQYLCILALGVFGVDRGLALSYGVLLHAIVFLPVTILGVALLWASGLTVRGSAALKVSEAPDQLPPQAVNDAQ